MSAGSGCFCFCCLVKFGLGVDLMSSLSAVVSVVTSIVLSDFCLVVFFGWLSSLFFFDVTF